MHLGILVLLSFYFFGEILCKENHVGDDKMDDAASNLTKVSKVLQNRFSLELYDFVATNVPQKTLAPSRDAKPYIFSTVPASSK